MSGPAGSRPAVLIGTKRGLFMAVSDGNRLQWRLSAPLLAGREVYQTAADAGGTLWAATRHSVWGPHIHRSRDGGETWEVMPTAPHHTDDRGVHAVWCLVPGTAARPERFLAGIEPAGLFISDDGGSSWRSVAGLNEHPTASTWQPAGGSLALHSVTVDPRDDDRIYCAVSAGGVYRSEDGGETWVALNAGVRADFLPVRFPESGQCVHRLLLHPARPDRLYQQNHCGVYRSDDRGETWVEITSGLPTDFGYALATDPEDPDSVFVIPEESSHMRTVSGGRLAVYGSRDAGRSWRALTDGLPQSHVYVSVLREGLSNDAFRPVGLYVGTSGGHVFASADGGQSWRMVAGYLPRVLSVHAVTVGPSERA